MWRTKFFLSHLIRLMISVVVITTSTVVYCAEHDASQLLPNGMSDAERDAYQRFLEGNEKDAEAMAKAGMSRAEFAGGKYTFRKTSWGMSVDDVGKSETAELVTKNSKLIAYKDNILNKDVVIIYIFADNKLVSLRF